MPRKILITPAPNSPFLTPYYIEVYDFSVVIPIPTGIQFLSVDGPLPEDAAREAVRQIGADVKEFFLKSRKERGTRADYWRVRVEGGEVASVEKTETTFKEFDRMEAENLKAELVQLKRSQRKARKAKG